MEEGNFEADTELPEHGNEGNHDCNIRVDERYQENPKEENHESRTVLKEKPIPLYKIPFKGKWKKYYDTRHFKKEWHEMYPWIEEDPNDPRAAVCQVCNKQVRAHKSVLESHQKTKTHLKKLSGYADIEDEELKEEPKEVKIEGFQPQVIHPLDLKNENLEPIIIDNHLAYFTESPLDAAHNAVTNIIDGLVEKHHHNRIENLKIENEVKMQMQAQQAALTEARNQHLFNQNIQSQMYKQQEFDLKLKLLQHQQETSLNSMEKEWNLKLKSVEQQLLFSRHLYEKKSETPG